METYSQSAFQEPSAWCHICDLPVSLETSKADEDGQAVHENCYVESIAWGIQEPYTGTSRNLDLVREGGLNSWNNFGTRTEKQNSDIEVAVLAKNHAQRLPSWSFDVAAVLVLAIVCWLAYGDHSPAIPPAITEASNTLEESQAPVVNPIPASKSGFKRVRVGQNEIDYVAEDVTIRHFGSNSALPMMHVRSNEVAFGDDVTVRHFVPALSQSEDSPLETSDRSALRQR